MRVLLGVWLERAFWVFFLHFVLSLFLLLKVLAQIIDNKEIAVRQTFFWYFDVDIIPGEYSIGSIDHLPSILLGEILAIWIDGGFETILLFGRSPTDFFGVIAEESVSEQRFEVMVNFLSFVFVDYDNIVDFFIIEIDVVDSSDCQQEDIQIYLRDGEFFKIFEGLSHQFSLLLGQDVVGLLGVLGEAEFSQDVAKLFFIVLLLIEELQVDEGRSEIFQEFLSSKFLLIDVFQFGFLLRFGKLALLFCSSFGIEVQKFINGYISYNFLASFCDFRDMIIDNCVLIPLLVFQLIESLMHVFLVLFLLLVLFGIDFRRKGHGSSILFFNPLLECGGLLVDFGEMFVLAIQKLFQIASALAFAAVDVRFEGAVGESSAFDLHLQLVHFMLLVDDVLRGSVEIFLGVSFGGDVSGLLFLPQIRLEFD